MLKSINPTDESVVFERETDNRNELNRKLDSAKHAFSDWKTKSFSERAKLLYSFANSLRDDKVYLGELMTREMGKPVKEALPEVEKCAMCFDHYATHAEAYLADEIIESDATRSWVHYQPLGTVLGILPWNAPLWLMSRVAAPALMAGNTVIIKHDPHLPGCASALAEHAGKKFPPGILQFIFIETEEVEAVIRDDRVQAVSFTGSAKGGSKVAEIASSEIKPSVLELGGSDPAIVLADADLDKAVEVITTMRIMNAGQSCIAAKRILVEESIYDQFIEKFKERLSALKVGDPAKESTDVGPIARADLRDTLDEQVKNTVDSGARCVLGGIVPDSTGFFYPITLLVDVPNDSKAFCEETFGPVAAVMPVRDAEQAITVANQSNYGLAGSVWTTTERGIEIANRLETGQVAINGLVKTDPRLPSGGIKHSGYGRELGPHGIKEFVNVKQIWLGPTKPVT
ncbi:MAG: NAD-dependent succinate-semialdehyde dehydrogenase [Gammaproteobacteria bacterium]|nr:aldehyde dehydrogenase family protein [Gammaproteobacteria bacterium]NIN62427.1 aldehyde dehydrogenase family protein [Gammaproteobacteria bacterium]NIO63022.1 aldehyde dehydrogenase family protein [Gammaproteobacteria bacterium]NIP49031.1 NAD-dependent succinate-semialdehyde dehydrogenase [Gammaproteobacteria bacterium]NIQ09487.1 NAD-dependent succinate-semialdehyde dehydrogenase [Gammaproteobacteria bacterium]